MTDRQALMARLEAFVNKLLGRQQELLAEAAPALAQMNQEHPGEIAVVKTALGDLQRANEEVITALRLTWDQQISEMFEATDDSDFEELGHNYYEDSVTRLEDIFRVFESKLTAEAHRAAWPLVAQSLQKPRACPQCGGPVTVQNPIEPETIKCPHCNAVNQTFPETLVGYYYAGAPRAFAEAASVQLQCEAQLFRTQCCRLDETNPSQHLKNLERWYAMEHEAARRYVESLAQFHGQPVDPAAVAQRVASCLRELQTDPVWRKAHP